ncbi:helix-turn-helix domain-containing protein [Antrihabitans sp. YC2-6]|nr:helix-turn-helix domain-containing protein [Antrihabitans sp. YC2-6]
MIIESVPELADEELVRDLRASTTAQLRVFLAGLVENDIPVPPPAEARALARTIARRGLDLRVLMQVYRAGQHAAIRYLSQTVAEQELDQDFERALTSRMYTQATMWMGISLEELTDTYTEEREIGLRDVFTRRSETVRAILGGDPIEPDAASVQVSYRLSGRHLGFVLWTDGPGEEDVIGVLDRFAHRIAAALGSAKALTVPSGARGMWAWLQAGSVADLGKLDALRADAAKDALRVAFGARGDGIDGFRRSHREALAARQVAQNSGTAEWLTDYLDVELVHLVSADAEGMRALVGRELSGLHGNDANAARLRETLRTYLRCQRSPEAAARELGVHKNTVRYRIQRIEELLGHDIDSRRLHLELALECADAFPAQAFPRNR